MKSIKRVRRFFREYKSLAFVILAMVTAGALTLAHFTHAANVVLAATALIAAIPLVWGMIQTIRDGGYGVDLLAATAIVTSVLLHQYWAAIVIVLMLTGGEALEDYAESRAKSELSSLLAHKPKMTHLLRGTRTVDIRVSAVQAGDKLSILPGEVVPVDAIVIDGTSALDESSLTGESLPVEKAPGDQLLSGSINTSGVLTVQALRVAADSQYEQIIKLVRAAANNQAPFVRLADQYSIPFTIVSFIIAGVAWFVSGEAIRFLEVLVVATPCPLLLGAPIALISGMSRAAKHGIIIKTGSALERLAAIRTIAFDKTGTLTNGKPVVSSIETYGKTTKKDILHYAAALEANSNHVLAQAILKEAEKQDVKFKAAKHVKELAGRGLSGKIDGKQIQIGHSAMLKEQDIETPKTFKLNKLKQTTSLVAIDGKLVGVILFEDQVRDESAATLRSLRKYGVKHIAMITGDNEATAVQIAKQLDITDVYPDCLPRDKILAVEAMPHGPVGFVGDGVNDAPVLTAADVGIALGARGSTAASESADVVVLHDDVSRVARAVEIAQRTFRIAKQSILIGIFISLALMGVFATGKFTALQGAIIQEFVDVIVIINALRAHGTWKKLQA